MAEEKAILSKRRTHLINLVNVGTKNLANAFETLCVSRRISFEKTNSFQSRLSIRLDFDTVSRNF